MICYLPSLVVTADIKKGLYKERLHEAIFVDDAADTVVVRMQ